MFVIGCSSGGGGGNGNNTANVQGKVVILQAYGNGPTGGDNPAGVSRSFVELYNISDEAINLSGISLYYADGIRAENVSEDEVWKSIPLTGTIPAKGSFLILGKKHDHGDTTARYVIPDIDGDIVNNDIILSRRAFKVALIKGTATLTVQNPFDTDDNGAKVSGYIDMVGALNNANATPPDNIFGYEAAPARCSASEAVRRKDLTDTDNNFNDFISARYALTGEGAFSDEMLELRKPRNSSAGEWDPFESPEEDPFEPPDTTAVDYSKLKLNEVSGVGGDSEKFYELKNIGTVEIPLYNCKIYYNARPENGTLSAGVGNLTWTGTSQTIAAGGLKSLIGRDDPVGTSPGSFTTGLTAQRILIITLVDPDGNELDKCVRTRDTGDYAITDKSFSRIPDGTGDFYFTTPTPNATNGTSTAGLTKLPNDPPIISNLSRNKESVTATDVVTVSATVTKDKTETSISSVVIQWTLNGASKDSINMSASGNVYSGEIPAQALGSAVIYKVYATNNHGESNITAAQGYTVVSTSEPPPPPLLIFQVGAATDGNISHSFVELYNTGTVAVSLTGYSLQYAAGYSTNAGNGSGPGGNTTTDGSWSKIDLSGTIQPGHSFLILGNKGTAASPALSITDNSGDINASFTINNRCFKVALMSNTTLLTVQNPFNTDGLGTKATGYIDMVGALNTANTDYIQGYEGTRITNLNKQTGQRRKTLTDNDDNGVDFERAVYENATTEQKELRRPKNHAYGAWNPITGVQE